MSDGREEREEREKRREIEAREPRREQQEDWVNRDLLEEYRPERRES